MAPRSSLGELIVIGGSSRQRLFSKRILAPNSGSIDLGEGVERNVGNEEKEGLKGKTEATKRVMARLYRSVVQRAETPLKEVAGP